MKHDGLEIRREKAIRCILEPFASFSLRKYMDQDG